MRNLLFKLSLQPGSKAILCYIAAVSGEESKWKHYGSENNIHKCIMLGKCALQKNVSILHKTVSFVCRRFEVQSLSSSGRAGRDCV